MPLNYEDQEFIADRIVGPIKAAINEKFDEFKLSLLEHDARLKAVENGQREENRDIESIKLGQVKENRDIAEIKEGNKVRDEKLDGLIAFKGKVLVVYGAIMTFILALYGLLKDRFMAWLRGHK